MSVSALPPTAHTTLVIELGASSWPNSPGFQASKAFMHAAHGFRDYLLDPDSFGLPKANLLDLFDAATSASDQLEQLGSFLEKRTRALKEANLVVRDVLVYFVGHGGFVGPSADFYLMPRRTNASSLRASGMAIEALAEVLREKARQMRWYLVLDCCFAAAAFRSFQGGPDQAAITKTLDAFTVQARSRGFPKKGIVLLCSSDQKSPSLLLPDESCTMFSYALLDVLENGDPHRQRQLSLRDLKELAEDRLAGLPEKNAPRLSLHSPDQSEGDVAEVPFFPNPRAGEVWAHQAEQERADNTMEQTSTLPGQSNSLASGWLKRLSSPYFLVILTLVILIVLSITRGSGTFTRQGGEVAFQCYNCTPTPTWHSHNSGTSGVLSYVVWAGSQFVVVGNSGTILTSPDGSTWNLQKSVTPYDLHSVTWADSQFVAVGNNGIILTSPDGHNWTRQKYGNTQLNSVVWSGSHSQFVVVGSSGTILTSPDGSTWNLQKSVTSQSLNDVVSADSQFVAVGNSGTILTSPDGHNWTRQVPDHLYDLYGVTYASIQSDPHFIAVGDGGAILTSPDGSTWTTQSTGGPLLKSVVWSGSGSQFVVVGDSGTILTYHYL